MFDMKERLIRLRSETLADLTGDVLTLARDLDLKGEDTTPSQHPADVASDLYAREELVTEELTLQRDLREIDDALRRIENGSYGRCVECGSLIAQERLEALPQAARCIECQRRADRQRR